ncbi:SUMF1/EgtB/PvdO family nonheme iron enzyme [Haloferula sp. A504]|uniref:SUMF1/EgtB/PvdO family nonheme iron enzyme n=1 Tax=Haloferula sp. A504 TaxID=3373601 RepID=UPI0031CB8522|nr:SUMF1/EgtB/PvdO family nonheme iron enzyme [Verrucomicrobiaceae bacterium E54]
MTSPLRLLPLVPFLAVPVLADTFGSGANEFTIDFVDIGDAGNADDNTGYGGVDYAYRMSTYEISGAMIDSYNVLSGGPAITRYAPFSADQPATSVSWNEAARFVNWLNTSSGYSAAYKFETGGGNDNIALWTGADAGYDASNPFRNSNAYYFLPSEDEWYKAAYYDPSANGGSGGYWDYATGSDTAPTTTSGGTTAGTAVYRDGVNPNPPGPADITNAGGLSPYGTMAQNGNVWEWGESGFTAPNDSAGESRVFRGGGWNSGSFGLASSDRFGDSPTSGSSAIGFRVAAVPEPSGAILTVVGMMGLLLRRKRV